MRVGDVAGVLALVLSLAGGGTYAYAAGRPTHDTVIVSSSDEGGSTRYDDEGATEAIALCPSGYVVTGGGVMYDIDYKHPDVTTQASLPFNPDPSGRQGWIGQVTWGPEFYDRVPITVYAVCLQRRH